MCFCCCCWWWFPLKKIKVWFTYNNIIHVYNIVILHLYTLQCDHHNISSNHLSQYKVIAINQKLKFRNHSAPNGEKPHQIDKKPKGRAFILWRLWALRKTELPQRPDILTRKRGLSESNMGPGHWEFWTSFMHHSDASMHSCLRTTRLGKKSFAVEWGLGDGERGSLD